MTGANASFGSGRGKPKALVSSAEHGRAGSTVTGDCPNQVVTSQ
jgi:hypothetical protein